MFNILKKKTKKTTLSDIELRMWCAEQVLKDHKYQSWTIQDVEVLFQYIKKGI